MLKNFQDRVIPGVGTRVGPQGLWWAGDVLFLALDRGHVAFVCENSSSAIFCRVMLQWNFIQNFLGWWKSSWSGGEYIHVPNALNWTLRLWVFYCLSLKMKHKGGIVKGKNRVLETNNIKFLLNLNNSNLTSLTPRSRKRRAVRQGWMGVWGWYMQTITYRMDGQA